MSEQEKEIQQVILNAERLVQSWPPWKRNILEASAQPQVAVPRKPVENTGKATLLAAASTTGKG